MVHNIIEDWRRCLPCLWSLLPTLTFVLQTVLSSRAGRQLSLAALGMETGKISPAEHCICLPVFCTFARNVRDQSLTLLSLCHQPHLVIHTEIFSKITTRVIETRMF